jgi:predicted phage tail protein
MNSKLKEVKLLGELGRRFGRVWNLAISTPAQAIAAIACNCPEFMQYLYESEDRGVAYRVVVDEPEGIGEEFLNFTVGDRIIIAPIVMGAGGNFGKILLGGVLLGASFFMPASVGIFGFSLSSTTVGLLGASLMLSGISGMLTPTPKTPDNKSEKTESYLFGNSSDPGNQGQCVPKGYGEIMIVDPIRISLGISTQEIPIG